MIIWKIANTEIVDRTGNCRKTVCGSWKGKHICFIEAKGTIMVDGSTSIAPLMEVINVCTVAQLRASLLLKSLEDAAI